MEYYEDRISVLAILSIIFAIIIPPLGIILGIVALTRMGSIYTKGSGIATAAIIIGCIMSIVPLLLFILSGLFDMGFISNIFGPELNTCKIGSGIECENVNLRTVGLMVLTVKNNLPRDITQVQIEAETGCMPERFDLKSGKKRFVNCRAAKGEKGDTYKHDLKTKYVFLGDTKVHESKGRIYAEYN